MWKNLRLRPILASVLVLAFTRGAFAASDLAESPDVERGYEYYSAYDYAGRMDFTVTYGGDTNVVKYFPLYLKIQDNKNGFNYTDLLNSTNDLRFFDSTGRVLDYEIETWNPQPNGESSLWVLVPTLRKGATISMCWNLRDGCKLPSNVSTNVWRGYVGVWHMDETITSATAEKTYSADATGHGLDAKPSIGPDGVYSTMTSAAGVFGNARVNDTSARKKKQGSYLFVDNKDGWLDFGDTFTVSFWVKFDDYANWPQMISCRTNGSWQASGGFKVELVGDDKVTDYRQKIIARGDKSKNDKDLPYVQVVDEPFKEVPGFTHLAFVYHGTNISIYADGVSKSNNCPCVAATAALSGMAFGNNVDGTEQSLWGKYDEIRLFKGVKGADWIAAENAQGTNALTAAGWANTDTEAVLQNSWKQQPSMTKTTWENGTYPTKSDFAYDPAHGKEGTTVTFYDRTTGKVLWSGASSLDVWGIPQSNGEYRVVFQVPQSGSPETGYWGALGYTLEFRVVSGGGKCDFGLNVAHILLLNDDYTVKGGEVEGQSYSKLADWPYWLHLDEYGNDAASPSSPEEEDEWSVVDDFNLGGGTRHVYGGRNEDEWLWFMDYVRIGNTFNNGAYVWEYGDEGLRPEQNYLPWNYDSQRVVGYTERTVGGYHRYVGQAVMQNKLNAAIVSPLYTNGIGTIYFDAVNGWTNNTYDEDGMALYKLVVEVATQTKPDDLTGQVHPLEVQWASSNPDKGVAAYDPFHYGDWKSVPMHVLRFDEGVCTDLGEWPQLTLDIENGGSCDHFYRVYVPVTNVFGKARFRIRRVAIDPVLAPDGDWSGGAYILVDNIICSTPSVNVQLGPCGEFFPEKKGKQVLGREGAFAPAFPSMSEKTVYGRAKATLNGQPAPAGLVTAAAMHYRWHYLDQRTTEWQVLDLNPSTLYTVRPLSLPLSFQGDIDFWFDSNQSGNYYEYADYSGTDLGLAGKYSEMIPCYTNRQSGADWFVRTREGKSDYSEMKIVLKGGKKPVAPIDMYLTQDGLWRGFVSTSNIVEGGVYWRIEPRNKQTDGAETWSWNTNYWYVLEWDQSVEKLPTFPAAGRMSEGDTNSWSRLPKDPLQTGYLMFQVDEAKLGVTIVRADYQDFNDWNDANNGYFVGASVDPASKKGTSKNVRTYDESYKGWADTPSVKTNWMLSFDYKIDSSTDWIGYKTFSHNNWYDRWPIGKGMWVYGMYREPASNIALQMAGCGEGYVEFVPESKNQDDLPRGIGEVSFKARLAQAVSPIDAAYFDEGKRLTDYTFVANTCFDMKQNRGFAGNASLSLFAYYRAGEGAYEARWEQVKGRDASNPNNKTEVLDWNPRGQRLVISRWDALDQAGSSYKETVLFAVTNDVSFNHTSGKPKGVDMPVMPFNGSSETNNMMPFCISVFEERGTNIIVAAVRIANATETTAVKSGVDWNTPISSIEDNWYVVFACDGSPKKLRGGTYGVLPSNCEGMFLMPQYARKAVYPSNVTDPAELLKWKANFYSKTTLKGASEFDSCYNDIPWWEVDPGRVTALWDFDPAVPFGFLYVASPQTVDVYTRPRSAGSSWNKLGQITVDSFGEPGKNLNCVTNLYHASDCYLRLQTGGTLDGVRMDVAINDIVVGQWRGEDDWSSKDEETASVQNQYGPTNIIFTTGWVTNGAVRLSAKRTEAKLACSVRSPLFDGKDGRGVGLGRFDFWYRPPHTTNVSLQVQICTNESRLALNNLKTVSQSVETGADYWDTVTNLTYETLKQGVPAGGQYGHFSLSLGLHGVKGLMRVAISNGLVKAVANVTDETAFGEIDIVAVQCKDEPALDKGCWWGWNMRTIGNPSDQQHRMYLPDGPVAPDSSYYGLSLALNNSITDGVDPAVRTDDIRQHMPFVQSPTFTNTVIGQVTFKARKYDLSEYSPSAKVVVYGATENPDTLITDDKWEFVAEFEITNTLYTTYTCKTDAQNFRALRLAVVDVKGTQSPPDEPPPGGPAQRVMIDEVSISEAVRAMLAFRNVGAFRSDLEGNAYVKGVTTKEEQPLCDENWGVQGELFATMLGEEIFTDEKHPINVRLHWYVGDEPWGYENWKKLPIDRKNRTRGVAYLGQADGSNLVYRSSYKTNPESVLPAQTTPSTVVQYMLEVQYWTINSTKEGADPVRATNWLDSASWTVPSWYAPVDYNADAKHGAGKTFAAFTILDTVAPGWAWLNEMNIFGVRKSGGGNSEQASQFVEVCVPAEADLTGWKVRMLDAFLNGKVETNNVATFGVGRLTGKKQVTSGMRYGKVFRSIGTKEGDGMKYADGTLDAPWVFSNPKGSFAKGDDYYYISDCEQPIGVQLLRPSGIIEHSIVVIGTNRWGRLPGTKAYDPTNFVAILNRSVPGSRFFYAGEDCCGEKRTDSVMRSQGEDASAWTNNWVFTPGNLNHAVDGTEQTIGDHPSPQGDSIVIYTSVDTKVGHITYKVGDGEATTEPQMIVLKRGSDVGTNITYYVAPWYELASVTTNDAPFWKYQRCVRETNVVVGIHASNTLHVVGTAQVNSDLADKYGLTKDNPFTPAVMDWLEEETTLQKDAEGNYKKFANPGEIHLADYRDSRISTNLTLTQMYCLDMDPTVSNLLLQTWLKPTNYDVQHEMTNSYGEVTGILTNSRVTVFMMITNRNEYAEPAAWSPYVLRGLEPGSHSLQFKNSEWKGQTISSWTSETFKVTGILWNDKTIAPVGRNYIPLNWFVFHEDSFYQETADGHERFTTEIEILDPHSQSSPGAIAGWYDWCRKHGWAPVLYSWAIDLRLPPVSVEVLTPNNYWE